MLFTDGLVAVQNAGGELYTEGLLHNPVRDRLAMPVAELLDDLPAHIQEFSSGSGFMDDVCLVGVEPAE